jgi:hypothetical protein
MHYTIHLTSNIIHLKYQFLIHALNNLILMPEVFLVL